MRVRCEHCNLDIYWKSHQKEWRHVEGDNIFCEQTRAEPKNAEWVK